MLRQWWLHDLRKPTYCQMSLHIRSELFRAFETVTHGSTIPRWRHWSTGHSQVMHAAKYSKLTLTLCLDDTWAESRWIAILVQGHTRLASSTKNDHFVPWSTCCLWRMVSERNENLDHLVIQNETKAFDDVVFVCRPSPLNEPGDKSSPTDKSPKVILQVSFPRSSKSFVLSLEVPYVGSASNVGIVYVYVLCSMSGGSNGHAVQNSVQTEFHTRSVRTYHIVTVTIPLYGCFAMIHVILIQTTCQYVSR